MDLKSSREFFLFAKCVAECWNLLEVQSYKFCACMHSFCSVNQVTSQQIAEPCWYKLIPCLSSKDIRNTMYNLDS